MGSYKRTLKRVYGNFVESNLIDICEREIPDFAIFGEARYFGNLPDDLYIYQDNGADILGVAHLDTVQQFRHASIVRTKMGEPLVFSPGLDDRLGAWVILDLLPRLGVKSDWLLTTGEETGSSTAAEFAKHHVNSNGKHYNWLYQFDRTGTDVVMYDYDTPHLRSLLRSVGMQPASGSFSDICSMEQMRSAGFNVGVGYEDYHSPRAYAWLSDTFSQVARFVDFYRRYGSRSIPHTPRPPRTTYYSGVRKYRVTINGKEHIYYAGGRDWWEDDYDGVVTTEQQLFGISRSEAEHKLGEQQNLAMTADSEPIRRPEIEEEEGEEITNPEIERRIRHAMPGPIGEKLIQRVEQVRAARITAASNSMTRFAYDPDRRCYCSHLEVVHKVAHGACESPGCTCLMFREPSTSTVGFEY